jgi:hypothetical protein
LKLDGIRCNSPAVRGKKRCYFHEQLQRMRRPARSASARAAVIELPPLEDALSIQAALMQVTRAILNDQISDKKAGLLLYALQTAATNLRTIEKSAPQAEALASVQAERLVRQDYPEAVEAMERIKAKDGEVQDSLAKFLLERLGIPYGDDHECGGLPPSPYSPDPQGLNLRDVQGMAESSGRWSVNARVPHSSQNRA